MIDEMVAGREEDDKTEIRVRVEWRLKEKVSGCVWDV
jgi:hypothetical protein